MLYRAEHSSSSYQSDKLLGRDALLHILFNDERRYARDCGSRIVGDCLVCVLVLGFAHLQIRTNRNWRYHKELKQWLTKDTNFEPVRVSPTEERGYYIFFDPNLWQRQRVGDYFPKRIVSDLPTF